MGSGSSSSGTSGSAAGWWTTGEGEIGAGAGVVSTISGSGATGSLGTSAEVLSSAAGTDLSGGVKEGALEAAPPGEVALATFPNEMTRIVGLALFAGGGVGGRRGLRSTGSASTASDPN